MKGKPKKLCVVTIGFQDVLVEADDAVRLFKALSNAVEVTKGYDHGQYMYDIGNPISVGMANVDERQLRAKQKQQTHEYHDHKLLPPIERKFLPRPKS